VKKYNLCGENKETGGKLNKKEFHLVNKSRKKKKLKLLIEEKVIRI